MRLVRNAKRIGMCLVFLYLLHLYIFAKSNKDMSPLNDTASPLPNPKNPNKSNKLGPYINVEKMKNLLGHVVGPGESTDNISDSCEQVFTKDCLNTIVMKYADAGTGTGQVNTEGLKCRGVTLNIYQDGPFSQLKFPMCFHEISDDQYISLTIARGGLWEPATVRRMATWLMDSPKKGLIDLGANIGTYALTAANLRHPVVAVEPMPENVKRLRKAVELARLQKNVTVLTAGVGDVRTHLYLKVDRRNRGGNSIVDREECLVVRQAQYWCNPKNPIRIIQMDDLVGAIPFKEAIMKIDIEGYEIKAFAHAQKLFQEVDITHVIMEWLFYKMPAYTRTEEGRKNVEVMMEFFTSRGYRAKDIDISAPKLFLNLRNWDKWPNDIVWVKAEH